MSELFERIESDGVRLIALERNRQIEEEGFTEEHDDDYEDDELLQAAAGYLLHEVDPSDGKPAYWPWFLNWWKPADRKRNLVKAGALIAAEIDRIVRAEKEADGE